MRRLHALGYDAAFDAAFTNSPHPAAGLRPARVVEQQRGVYRVAREDADLLAEVAGRLRHEARGPDELPAVGDWVAVDPGPAAGRGTIRAVLPRRSVLARKTAGGRSDAQVLAANVDLAILATAAVDDWNPRRLERYLAFAWEGGVQPLVALTKVDLHADAPALLREVEGVALGAPVVGVSAVTGAGLDALAAHLAPGRTAVLLGSSGVGKSTLVNRLLGHAAQATGDVRTHDGRGTHTTTSRRLLALPGGALLVDTPGIRELGLLDEEGLGETFDDVAERAAHCRFRDCAHAQEPGCAVLAAVAEGALPAERLDAWHALRREAAFQARRHDARLLQAERRKWKAISKSARRHPKGGRA